ncbi:hypothetical protein BTVI_128238 [Pitangus sulphuratus]|nr:hypothetical protein BTVI_128238 [Pitangus sulphuratus]
MTAKKLNRSPSSQMNACAGVSENSLFAIMELYWFTLAKIHSSQQDWKEELPSTTGICSTPDAFHPQPFTSTSILTPDVSLGVSDIQLQPWITSSSGAVVAF